MYRGNCNNTKITRDSMRFIGKSKNRTIVEYALKSANKPIDIATYSMYNKLPDNMKNLLPTPEEIVERLRVLDLYGN